MRALQVHQGVMNALKGGEVVVHANTPPDNKALKIEEKGIGMMEKAHSAIILSLGDRVLREVSNETIATGVWIK